MRTNRLHSLVAGALALALACFVAGLAFRTAGAQCGYTALTSGTPVAVGTSPSFFTINQTNNYWTAVAVAPQSGTDWDISVWQDTYPYPGCVTTLLAGSALGGSAVDFIVGDYNFNAFGTRYIEANRYSGSGNASLEWNATNGQLVVNGPRVTCAFSALTVYVYDVYLQAGTTYAFGFDRTGSADIHWFLFRNSTQGTCWMRRLDADFDATVGLNYTPPTSGFYGVVLVDDNGLQGDAHLTVSACTPPIALSSGVPTSADLAHNYYSFDQEQNYWTAVGLRANQWWTLEVHDSFSGTPPGSCFSGDPLAASNPTSSAAAIVVGDFDYDPKGTYYVGAHYYVDAPGGVGTVQWDDDADRLTVNGMFTNGSMTAGDVVRVWDVLLQAGTTYHFTFNRSGADLELLLFRNPSAGGYWAGRGDEILHTTSGADYTAPTSGYYGVVIVNDDGASGTYAVGVGTCTTPVDLTALETLTTTFGENYVGCDMHGGWQAVGVRGSDPATDWDIVMQSDQSAPLPFPECRGPELAVSDQNAPTVDFVVGDFFHNSSGYYYAWPHTYSGQGSGQGWILWSVGTIALTPNDQLRQRSFDPGAFLDIEQVYLTAGRTYWLRYFGPDASGSSLMLFRNPTSGTYWAPRSSAAASDPGGENYSYVAPATDWYGTAVVYDGGPTGVAWFGIGECSSPTALASGTAVFSDLARNYYSFAQAAPYWTAVGERGATRRSLSTFGSPSGGDYPECFGNGLAASGSTSTRAELVVGDFNHNPYGTYYVLSQLADHFQPSQPGGSVEWQAGAEAINVGDPPVNRTSGSGDVVEVWDCWLAPQKYYTFEFSHTGTADLKLLVFRNTGGGTYWVGRDGAQLELTSTATWKTTGATSQYYGLAVVNDNGQPGTYSLQVIDPGTVAVDEPALPITRFSGVQPNPARGGVHLEFMLHEPADVSFQVLDMAGRLVATLPAQAYGVGRGAIDWDRRGVGGARLPTGLYFVRMKAGDRVIGTRRCALLD